MEKILELKTGSVNVDDVDKYNKLIDEMKDIRKRLDCVTNPTFKAKYFKLGDYGSSSAYENRHYMILATNRSKKDEKLEQEIIDFLTVKFIEQLNEVITEINGLIK